MTIYFDNGMGIQTDTNFRVIGSDGSSVRANIDNTSGMLERAQPVWRCIYHGTGGGDQYVYPAGKVAFNTDYGGEGNHYNFSTYEFICPVPGNYRLTMQILFTGNPYSNPSNHYYPYINGTYISNAIHHVGSANYITCSWTGIVRASAGDYLWWGNNGGRSYTGGWSVVTYQLLG
jgi:hypothetical protein